MRSRIELVAVRVGNGGDHLFAARFAAVEAVVVLITNGRGQELKRQTSDAGNGEDQESGGHAARSGAETGTKSTASRWRSGIKFRSRQPWTVV